MSNNTILAAVTKWWQSEGFWSSVLLLVSGFFVGFPLGEAQTAFQAVIALVAAFWAVRGKIKDIKPITWKEWINKPNTWTALVTVVVAIFPVIPVEALESLGQILRDILGQNWQGVAVGFFALLNIIINRFRK